MGPWSEEIEIFNPVTDNGYGNFMHWPGDHVEEHDTAPDAAVPDLPGLAYGPLILFGLSKWHPESRTLELHYLMSTWRPYQVHHMRSLVQIE